MSDYKFTIGIDIGTNGAIVIQHREPAHDDNAWITMITHPMPYKKKEMDIQALYRMLQHYEGGRGLAVFEKLVPYMENKSTCFSMGYQSGLIEMALVALSIPYVKVPPRTWQKEMFLGVGEVLKGGKRDTKGMALIAAKRRFPSTKLTFGDRATKPHDGLVDALLMSEYAKKL